MLNLYAVITFTDCYLKLKSNTLIAPFLKHESVIYPETHAIICKNRKAVGAGSEPKIALPAIGKVVCGYACTGRTVMPLEVDGDRVLDQHRSLCQPAVGEELAAPVARV
jgi:hypothetical protein